MPLITVELARPAALDDKWGAAEWPRRPIAHGGGTRSGLIDA